MKTFIATLFFFTLSQFVFGQSTAISADELLFEKGTLLQQLADDDLNLDKAIAAKDSLKSRAEYAAQLKTTILEKSLEYYQELIDKFPHSIFLYRALSNKAYAELALDDKEEAKKDFLTILQGTAITQVEGGKGSGIMADPYANYENGAAKNMAEISLKEGDYTKALAYLNLTKKFPYQHFCGNAHATDEIYMGEMYAKCYLGLNDYSKAYAAAFPNLFENGLADNTSLVALTYKALLKKFSKDKLKYQLEQAIKNYEIVVSKSGKYENKKYFITFLGSKIPLNFWNLLTMADMLKPDDVSKLIVAECRKSKFYTLLAE